MCAGRALTWKTQTRALGDCLLCGSSTDFQNKICDCIPTLQLTSPVMTWDKSFHLSVVNHHAELLISLPQCIKWLLTKYQGLHWVWEVKRLGKDTLPCSQNTKRDRKRQLSLEKLRALAKLNSRHAEKSLIILERFFFPTLMKISSFPPLKIYI